MNSTFKQFIFDEEEGEKKRVKIVQTILKAVKPKLESHEHVNNTDFFKVKCEGEVRETFYEIVVTIDYHKIWNRGMKRAVYVTVTKENATQRNSNYFTFDTDDISDVKFAETLNNIKTYFEDLVG